jgi:hypothetical protein
MPEPGVLIQVIGLILVVGISMLIVQKRKQKEAARLKAIRDAAIRESAEEESSGMVLGTLRPTPEPPVPAETPPHGQLLPTQGPAVPARRPGISLKQAMLWSEILSTPKGLHV